MADTSDLFAAAERIGGELHALRDRLSTVSTEFDDLAAALSTADTEPATPVENTGARPTAVPAPPAQPAPASMTPPQADPYPPRPAPAPPFPHYTQPPHYAANPYGQPPVGPPRPPVPAPPYRPTVPQRSISERLSDAAERGLIGRVLAAVGVGVTLIGVVLLLILAAQAGLLRPEIRIAGGALLALSLVGAGAFIGRREDKRSGAIALVATGIATALFDVLAAATIYRWLPAVPALLLGALIAGGGLWFAHRWNSQALGLMVSIPLLVFAPIVSGGVDETLIGFMLVYAAATLWLQIGRDWTALFVVNTAAAALPLLAATAFHDIPDWFLAGTLALSVALAIASALLLIPSSTQHELVALTSAAAAVPMLGSAVAFPMPLVSIVPAVGAALFAAAAFATTKRRIAPLSARAIWATSAAVLLTFATLFALDFDAAAAGILGVAIVVIVAASVAGDLRRALLTIGAVLTALGLLALVGDHSLEQLLVPTQHFSQHDRMTILIGILLGLVATTLLTWAWSREFMVRRSSDAQGPADDAAGVSRIAERLWIAGSLVNLWLVTQLCIATAALVTDGSVHGFRAGHTAATVIWFATAAAALLWARRLSGTTSTVMTGAGLALIAAAVAKLFLFDLAALDGFLRVIAFLIAGILLLALGVAYAQRLTSRDPQQVEQPSSEPAGRQ